MTRPSYQIFCRALTLSAAAFLLPSALNAQFKSPSQEELKMTSLPQVPNAPAVYLERERIVDDGQQTYSASVRIKVLTEAGKRYAEVQLPAVPEGKSLTIDQLQARTIHADGTIVPFTGQPADRSTPQGTVRVFTLPDVQVGSILEYHYKLTMPMQSPSTEWVLQSDLYTRKLHYVWKLSGQEMSTRRPHPAPAGVAASAPPSSGGRRGGESGGRGEPPAPGDIEYLGWTTYLPKTAELKQSLLPGGMGETINAGMRTIELDATDVSPAPVETDAPPSVDTLYHVLFYYSAYPAADEFWKTEGAAWSKEQEAFMTPGPQLTGAVQSMMLPGDNSEARLKKIYAAVMTLRNINYAPAGTAAAPATSAMQVWSSKSGSANQITEVFVAMARAAGFKAYVMAVPNGEQGVFMPGYLTLSQVPDLVAIVNVDGKERFFDPGVRYCTYGQLSWRHEAVRGLRQLDADAVSVEQATPGGSYLTSVTQRVADLTLGADGVISGPVSLYFSGDPALEWRHRALVKGEAAIQSDFKDLLAKMLPPGTDIQLVTIDNLTNGEQKLAIRYFVKGGLGSRAGGKITLPADPFEFSAAPAFTGDKRELPVDFRYPSQVQDILRIKFPAGYSVDSAPTADKQEYAKSAAYSFVIERAPGSITVRRTAIMADTIIPAAEYPGLKDYTAKLEQKSRQSVVLKSAGN